MGVGKEGTLTVVNSRARLSHGVRLLLLDDLVDISNAELRLISKEYYCLFI